jgi:glycolate oxidase
MGGTITGEHGIGITKAPYLEMEIPLEGIQLMKRIKTAFDPAGILNPGKIFS